MADTKITSLQPPQAGYSVVPATDVLPIVVIADPGMATSGSTRKVTVNQLLGAGGTATLASATITGDLTVDTSTLKVDSANDYVGVGTASPVQKLHLENQANSCFIRTGSTQNSAGFDFGVGGTGDATAYIYNRNNTPIVFGINSTTAMTLNSTGLGIGVASASISAKLHIDGNLKINGATSEILMATGAERTISASGSAGSTALTFKRWDGVSAYVSDVVMSGTGNVGIGVTPSASKLQVAGNIGLPNSCTASGETSGVFSIDVANLLTLTGGSWRQASILVVYSGIDGTATNPTILQTVVTLTGLSTWNAISKNDIVGTASVAVSNDTTTGARITVTVPTGNSGTVYAVLLGGAGATTRPSMTINA